MWNIKVFFQKLHLLYQFLMTKLYRTFMITLWIVNWFEKHILRIWNIASLLQCPLTWLAYCQSSKCLPWTRTQANRRALHQLHYQVKLHSFECRAKCSAVPQLRELVIGTRAARQGSKYVSKFYVSLSVWKFLMVELTALSSSTGRVIATF